RQLESLRTRLRMLQGVTLAFDEESQALYDAVAPVHSESFFGATLKLVDRLLPAGGGSLGERYEAYRKQFVIPRDRLGRVFDRAIAECRTRTLPHVSLPAAETFTVEYVKNKPCGGYNWYQGNYRS